MMKELRNPYKNYPALGTQALFLEGHHAPESQRKLIHQEHVVCDRATCFLHYILITFKENMMTSSNENISRVTGHLCGEFTGHPWISRTKSVTRSFDFSFICAWINGWVNNREADDLRRHRVHHDVTVMNFLSLNGKKMQRSKNHASDFHICKWWWLMLIT